MSDPKFSRPGQPATAFEHDLLRDASQLEDPWVEIAGIVGLDATLKVMDQFARCLLSCPPRDAFMARLLRVWQDQELVRLSRQRPRLSNGEIAQRVMMSRDNIRKRFPRALSRHLKSNRQTG